MIDVLFVEIDENVFHCFLTYEYPTSYLENAPEISISI
jgi:hypothetical protein